MKKIQFTTYDKRLSDKDKDRKRKPKTEVSFAINEIMALTTARGTGKWPVLYVTDYSEPLELPEQSFVDVKAKLIETSLSEYKNVNKFIPVGQWVLVNYEKVFQVKYLSGQIVFWDNRTLDGFDAEVLTEYEELSGIEHKKACDLQKDGTRLYLENIAKRIQESSDKRSNKFTRLFGTLDDKMVATGFLTLINIVLSIILIILIVLLLYKL